MHSYVLDTTAIFTMLNEERGIDTVKTILEAAQYRSNSMVYIPFMALMEAEYLLLRNYSQDETQSIITQVVAWPARLVESFTEWRHQAACLKSASGLSVADAWIASLAIILDAKLIHKDPEYDSVPHLQALRLPYK